MAQSAHHDLAPRTDTQLTPKHAANGIHGSSTCLDAQAGINSVFDLNSQHPTPLNTLLNTKRRRKRRQRMRGDEQRETGRATRLVEHERRRADVKAPNAAVTPPDLPQAFNRARTAPSSRKETSVPQST
ncbi:hypothetical protein PLEOSDRAFT_1110148 [Pleurotus ostreatus PC15]|uniref:Uncharacterized protein n=1 Tax=Pleurotus ostreatus (strain PC15) TaxID=1137138 RepID=A0A067NE16_PLEO1|nr:hypothetical protein PLEOSDRAFT_1110148 [Pleurotus ostreatus PC15]